MPPILLRVDAAMCAARKAHMQQKQKLNPRPALDTLLNSCLDSHQQPTIPTRRRLCVEVHAQRQS